MKLILYIGLAVICLITSLLYAITGSKKEWQAFLLKEIALFAILIFSITSNYLKGISDAVTLFILIMFAINLFGEMASKISDKVWVEKACKVVRNACLLTSVLALAKFNAISLSAGILLGVAAGLASWAFNGEKNKLYIVLNIFQLAMLGGAVGFGLSNILTSSHFILALIMFVGSTLLLIGTTFENFKKDKSIAIARYFIMLGFILLAGSTYFY